MAEVEVGGIKFRGGKIFVILTALTTAGGALWGGFEFYKDYLNMKDQIQEYVAPDLSGFDKEIALTKKEKAAKKIVKKMGDKGRYDSQNQLKTLIVMQVLGNTKTFFDSQKQLNDRVGFFTDDFLPDAVISDNNIASYFLFAGSDGLMNEMVMQQWQK